ncbi:MAG: FmdB family zinc ribbon protein [Acidithiobacillales bacterium]
MPMFEYVCRACGERFEELRSAKDEGPGPLCPECGSEKVVKLVSAFATGTTGAAGGTRGGSAASSCGGSRRFT